MEALEPRPYAPATDRNREPILEALLKLFADATSVLEIGSGTGQHAVYFGQHLPDCIWHTSDILENISGIRTWTGKAALPNVRNPILLDVTNPWPKLTVDAVFSANTAHIMSMKQVEAMFNGVGRLLTSGGTFCLYGPFNYEGQFTSQSNADFDVWLKARDPKSGIRDVETLNNLALAHKLQLVEDIEMPANNRLLSWKINQ